MDSAKYLNHRDMMTLVYTVNTLDRVAIDAEEGREKDLLERGRALCLDILSQLTDDWEKESRRLLKRKGGREKKLLKRGQTAYVDIPRKIRKGGRG